MEMLVDGDKTTFQSSRLVMDVTLSKEFCAIPSDIDGYFAYNFLPAKTTVYVHSKEIFLLASRSKRFIVKK